MKENCTSQFHLGRAMYEDFVLSPSHLLKQSSNILEEVSCSLQHVPHIGPQNVSALSLSLQSRSTYMQNLEFMHARTFQNLLIMIQSSKQVDSAKQSMSS